MISGEVATSSVVSGWIWRPDERVGDFRHFDQRQLRRGEDHDIDLVAGRAVGLDEGVDFGAADLSGLPTFGRRAGGMPAVRRDVSAVMPGIWNNATEP